MMVPQPTAQYGQVDRVSLARAIFSVRNCAYAGFKSKPKTAAAAPPIVVNFRKSRRVGFMLGPSSVRTKLKRVSRKLPNTTYLALCQALSLSGMREPRCGLFQLALVQIRPCPKPLLQTSADRCACDQSGDR